MSSVSNLTFLLALVPLTLGGALIPRQTTLPTQYIIYNNCPAELPLYISGELVDVLPKKGNTTRFITGDVPFINTNANGGTVNGTGTLRAGFKSEGQYYYLVKDPQHINTGIKIETQNRPQDDGFCVPALCEGVNCFTAFKAPPQDTSFPVPGPLPPSPPLFRCPFANTTYLITFCPSSGWAHN